MGKSDGEPQRSDGQSCPALQIIQETEAKTADNGEVVPIYHVAPETLAAIQHALDAGGIVPDGFLPAEGLPEISTGGKRKSSRTKIFGLVLLATGATLVSGLCYGLHCQTHANHKDSEARNFRCHTKVGRRRSLPDGPKAENDNGGLTIESGGEDAPHPAANLGLAIGHLLPSAGKERPECEARAECCVNRQPDGCVPHGPSELADIRAMLAEIRAGVVGLAQGPPVAAAPVSDNEAVRVFALMKALDDGQRNRKAPLGRVFRLLVLEGLSQAATAKQCGCSPGLVSSRVAEIQRRMKRPISELRALASRLGEMELAADDSRARKIYQRGLTDDSEDET